MIGNRKVLNSLVLLGRREGFRKHTCKSPPLSHPDRAVLPFNPAAMKNSWVEDWPCLSLQEKSQYMLQDVCCVTTSKSPCGAVLSLTGKAVIRSPADGKPSHSSFVACRSFGRIETTSEPRTANQGLAGACGCQGGPKGSLNYLKYLNSITSADARPRGT